MSNAVPKTTIVDVSSAKEALIRLVCGSLIKEPTFDLSRKNVDSDNESNSNVSSEESDDDTSTSSCRDELEGLSPPQKMLALGGTISLHDGEFLLKLAVYVRQFLGIRGTANFLTSIAAFQERCHPYLRAYLPKIVCLPTDWLQIATFARDSPLRKTCGLPTALRAALAESFGAFNEFSLAKYNTESAQKKRKKKGVASHGDSDEQGPLMPYTLKQMIRMLHISQPRYEVMCLLGKPYPATSQEFSELGLGTATREFDPTKANRRMRLAIPKTWETELASKGNHAHVWDELVAEKKLPFMAMLRNLRNIILQGCSRPTHNYILARLQSEEQVAASKQFPYRFFSAFDVLNIDPETAYDAPQVKREGAPTKAKAKPSTAPSAEQLAQLLKEYRAALEQAIALATKINVSPMSGRSMVLLHCSSALLQPVKAQGAKGIGSVRTKLDVALLLAIMLQYSCEACDFIAFTDDGATELLPTVDRAVGLLEMLTSTKERLEGMIRAASSSLAAEGRVGFPYAKLDDVIHRSSRVECVLLVSDQHVTFRGTNPCPALGDLPQYLSRMRSQCNPDLLFVALAIDGSASEPGIERILKHPNDVMLTGFSDSILRFIAERSNGGPRQFIERIDTVYRIDTSRVVNADSVRPAQRRVADDDADDSSSEAEGEDGGSSDSGSDTDSTRERDATGPAHTSTLASGSAANLVVERPMSSYRLARWFISSTFLDMQGERDELMFHVFPSLQRWIYQRGFKIDVAEIDFRWGIDSVDGYAATPVSVCLNEVSRCAPMVLGIVGDRYGSLNTLPRTKICADPDVVPADFDWLRRPQADESMGMSITELELRHAVHVTSSIRDGRRPQGGGSSCRGAVPWSTSATVGVLLRTITGSLPAPLTPTFTSESKENDEKLKALKSFVKSSPAVTVEGYQAAAAARSPASATAAAAAALDLLQFRERALSLMKRQLVAAYELTEEEADEDALESSNTGGSETSLSSSECTTDGGASSSDGEEASHSTVDTSPGEERSPITDQSRFRHELCQVYVPPRHSYSCVEKFFRGQPLVSTLDDEEQSVVDHRTAAEGSAPNVLLLHSEQGRGKSSFVSYVVERARESGDKVTVFFSLQALGTGHHGASRSEAALAACVGHLYSSLWSHFHLQDSFPAYHDFSSWQLASEQLPAVFQACCKQLRGSRAALLLVVIDGLDAHARDDTSRQRLLSQLPNLVPPLPAAHVKWILATHHASPFAAALRARALPCASYVLPDLTLPERVQLVRNHLATFGKVLRESVTKGNLLKQLCRKTDAGMTTYLLLALTFLRLFGNFDSLAQDVRRLPGTFSQLQTEVMRRCEVLFGTDVSATALAVIALNRDLGGIREDDLLRCCESIPSTTRLLNFLFHHRLIEGNTERGIQLVGDALHHAVQRRYLSRTADVHRYHLKVLRSLVRRSPAAARATRGNVDEPEVAPAVLVTPSILATMSPATVVATLYHALRSKHFAVVAQIGCDIHAIAAMARHGLLDSVLALAAEVGEVDRPTHRKLLPFVEFLVAHRHIVAKHPNLVLQCALNMPASSPVRRSALDDSGRAGLGVADKPHWSWVEWKNRSSHGEKECTQTNVVGHRAVLCATLSNRGDYLAVGGRDWRCRVIVNATSGVLHDLKHPNDVSAVSFSGNDSVVVTGCADGGLRVWSMADGCLIQEGNSHSRCVTGIALPLDGSKSICLTSSTDTTVQMWRIHSGSSGGGGIRAGSSAKLRPYRTSRIHRAPVSCCALHASGKVASASWDGVVVVQSSERDESRAVVMPVSAASAIRTLAFVPSMVLTVAAGSFDGRVFLLDVAGELVSAVFDMHCAVPLSSLHISSDAKFMLSADTAGCMKLWRQSVTGEIIGSFNGHSRTVCAARFCPTDSSACVSVSMDATARHWRVTHPGIDWPVGAVHDSRVVAVAVSHSGRFAVTACASGTAKVFCVVCEDDAGDTVGAEDGSTLPERPWLTIRANLHQNDSKGAAPLCFASIVAQDQLILLGDIAGRVGGWSASSGLEGSDALLRFTVVCSSATQPIRAVHISGASQFTAVTMGGESFSWLYDWERAMNSGPVLATPTPFGFTVLPEIRHPVVTLLSPPRGVEDGDGVHNDVPSQQAVEGGNRQLRPLLVTEHNVLHVDFGKTQAVVEASETWNSDGGTVQHNDAATVVRCGALCGAAGNLLLAFANGSVVLFSDSTAYESVAKVRLRDDRSHKTPLDVLCMAAAAPLKSSVGIAVVGGADHTFRVLRVARETITQVAMFHGSAPIRSVCCAPHRSRNGASAVALGGDDLGNVYKLELHLCLAASSSVDSTVEESAESTATETQTSRTRSGTTVQSESGTNWTDDYAFDQFSELGLPMPAGLPSTERRKWNQRQRAVLRDAVAASRTNPLAKAALRRYASASLQTFSVFCVGVS